MRKINVTLRWLKQNCTMNFRVCTTIPAITKESVMNGFTSRLFLRLAPPFPKLTLLRFDGSKKGDEIHLQLDFLLSKTVWVSLITESGTTKDTLYFIDEGKTVPPPIKKWTHKHIVRQLDTSVEIEDNLTYSSGNRLLDLLLFPPIYFLMVYRKPIYRAYFGNTIG